MKAINSEFAGRSEEPSKSSKRHKLIVVLVIIFILLCIAIVILLAPETTTSKSEPDKRSVEEYKRTWTQPISKMFSVMRGEYVPANETAIALDIKNSGFEQNIDGNDVPDGWGLEGSIDYVTEGCYQGKKCMHVIADDSDEGFLMLTSSSVPIEAGKYYNASFYLNCKDCNGEGAYALVAWMGKSKDTSQIVELKRNVILLNQTNGYQRKSIVSKAPAGVDTAMFGIRVHSEGAKVQKNTEFYLDGNN